jgi:hypothetical protein
VATPAQVTDRRNDPFDFTAQQAPAQLITPAATGLRTPVFAQGSNFPQVLGRMIKVEQFMHLLSCQL